jgi:hypothetical protein
MTKRSKLASVLMMFAAIWSLSATSVRAEDKLGGHFGFAVPLVTNAQSQTTTVSDEFIAVFPMGITVKRSDRFAFDLELAPAVHSNPRHIDLTIHPGLLYGLGRGWTAGGRLAFGVESATWGFTPLLNRSLFTLGDATVFGEMDLPVRFKEDSKGVGYTSVGLAIVFGLAF